MQAAWGVFGTHDWYSALKDNGVMHRLSAFAWR